MYNPGALLPGRETPICLKSEREQFLSQIRRLLVTVSNLLTIINNRWLAYQPVIIARWSIYLSVMQWSQFFSTSQSQPLILSINTTFQFLNHKVWCSQSTSLFNILSNTNYISPPQLSLSIILCQVPIIYLHHNYHFLSIWPINTAVQVLHLYTSPVQPPPDRIIIYIVYQILL